MSKPYHDHTHDPLAAIDGIRDPLFRTVYSLALVTGSPSDPSGLSGYVSPASELFAFLVASLVWGGVRSLEGLGHGCYRLARKLMRGKYYEAENRKRSLRKKRPAYRKIRVRTTRETELPSPDVIRGQWLLARKRGETLEKLRLGAMLAEIEATVDNSLIRNEALEIVGRRPGLRGWIRLHCPELAAHYKTLMRYKSMADKMQMVSGLHDPDPVLEVLPDAKEAAIENSAEAERKWMAARTEWNGRKRPSWTRGDRFVKAKREATRLLEESGIWPKDGKKRPATTLAGFEAILFEKVHVAREIRRRIA